MKKKKTKEQPKRTTAKISAANSVAYKGTVKVSIVKGNNILSTKSFKNSGRWPLFQFICYCINGSYLQADALRPRFIRFFYTSETTIPSLENLKNTFDNYFNLENNRSLVSLIPCLTDSKIITDKSDKIGSANITLKFMAPFSQIDTDRGGINMLGLYSNNLHDPGDAAAFIMIPDLEDSTKFGNLLTSEEIENANLNEYNLYIEWTLDMSNKVNA